MKHALKLITIALASIGAIAIINQENYNRVKRGKKPIETEFEEKAKEAVANLKKTLKETGYNIAELNLVENNKEKEKLWQMPSKNDKSFWQEYRINSLKELEPEINRALDDLKEGKELPIISIINSKLDPYWKSIIFRDGEVKEEECQELANKLKDAYIKLFALNPEWDETIRPLRYVEEARKIKESMPKAEGAFKSDVVESLNDIQDEADGLLGRLRKSKRGRTKKEKK